MILDPEIYAPIHTAPHGAWIVVAAEDWEKPIKAQRFVDGKRVKYRTEQGWSERMADWKNPTHWRRATGTTSRFFTGPPSPWTGK